MKKQISFLLSLLVFSLLTCQKEEPNTTTDLTFDRLSTPIFESPLNIAADPAMLRSGDTLFMYYSAENQKIGVVYSLDNGSNWIKPGMDSQTDYAALTGQPDNWDNTLETVDVIKVGDQYLMYYTGYREGEADNPQVENYAIGLAVSPDGINFLRHPNSINGPILARDTSNENTGDRHAMTSPGVVYENGTYYMIYAGWNVTNNWTGSNAGIRILGATSTDGLHWTKLPATLIDPTEVTYSNDINEASLIRSDDGYWYIPFSTASSIGIARALNFTDSYQVYPEAIVSPQFAWDSEVTAPDGLIEDGKLRLWYHGVKAPLYFPWVIGYSEAPYPLEW